MEQIEALAKDRLVFPQLGIDITINGDAFTIFGYTFKWYAIIITAGMILAILYGMKRMREFGIDSNRASDAIIGGVFGGLIGARAYYVIFEWESFAGNWKKIIDIHSGGLAIYGGIIGALLVGCIIAKIRKVRILPLLDITGICFLIGQGIGRWGNFFNHEAFGCNTTLPWGMSSGTIQNYLLTHQSEIYTSTGVTVDPYLPVHPCFLYESIWCIVGFVLLHFLSKRRRFDGEMFLIYLAWYGLGRAVIEGLRTDSLMIGTLRVSQLLSIMLVIAALILVIVFRSKVKRMGEDYTLYVNTEESKRLIAESEAEIEKEKKSSDRKKKRNKGDTESTDDNDKEEVENGTDN